MTRRCDDCVHVIKVQYHGLRCGWEQNFLPPPVANRNTWGREAPQTHSAWAEACRQYEKKETP